jgi:predicted porin
MQKKIIALAIASALTAPAMAFADSANANFYGVLNADVENVSVGTPAAAPGTAGSDTSRGRITSNASRLGVNGSDDLGNGLSAIYQLETRVNLAGNETTGGGVLFDGIRNSNIGLKGNFGTAFVGQWDTPYKVSHNKVELFDNTTIATATAIIGSVSGTANKFNVRAGSSIQYWTPDLSGFKVMAAYSFLNSSPDTANSNGTPNLMSFSAAYDQGPIYVAAAYESHKAAPVGTAAALTDKGERLVGAYTVDAFQVGLTYEKLTIGATGGDQSRTAYSVEGKYNMAGAGTIGATYSVAGDMGGVSNTGATQVSLRYGYMLSKRTEVYGMYTNINNKSAANYNFADVAQPSNAVGSKVAGYGLGVRHTF